MRKRFLSVLVIVACLVSLYMIPSSASVDHYGERNTFDIYRSSTCRRAYKTTASHSDVEMIAESADGCEGEIIFYQKIKIGSRKYVADDALLYEISSMKDGAKIRFYELLDGGSRKVCVATGRIHTNNAGKTFGSIIKINSLGGGYYLKY